MDEAYHYERYQLQNSQEDMLRQQMLCSGDDNIFICALCKSYVHRIQGSNRICCERRGCIDLDMRVSFVGVTLCRLMDFGWSSS
jgi:hypothetical protein